MAKLARRPRDRGSREKMNMIRAGANWRWCKNEPGIPNSDLSSQEFGPRNQEVFDVSKLRPSSKPLVTEGDRHLLLSS